jgi:hypothetical protein
VSTVPAADRFEIEQLIRPMVNLYKISANGAPVAFVRQKRMALKEDIRFFRDENETEELFRIKARKLMELAARYDVTAPDGERIGVLGKVFRRSLFRSTWSIMDPDEQELAVAQERSLLTAIFRRGIDLVPYGEFVPVLFHFSIDRGDVHLGDFTRPVGFRDRYTLDLSGDVDGTIDRRLAIALAIGLDALQSR